MNTGKKESASSAFIPIVPAYCILSGEVLFILAPDWLPRLQRDSLYKGSHATSFLMYLSSLLQGINEWEENPPWLSLSNQNL